MQKLIDLIGHQIYRYFLDQIKIKNVMNFY